MTTTGCGGSSPDDEPAGSGSSVGAVESEVDGIDGDEVSDLISRLLKAVEEDDGRAYCSLVAPAAFEVEPFTSDSVYYCDPEDPSDGEVSPVWDDLREAGTVTSAEMCDSFVASQSAEETGLTGGFALLRYPPSVEDNFVTVALVSDGGRLALMGAAFLDPGETASLRNFPESCWA